MREIKFRVWDIERKEYLPNTGNPYVFPFNGIVAIKRAGSSTGHFSEIDYSEYYNLEQFADLHDNKRTEEWPKGQPVYQEDIVRICNNKCQLQIFEAIGRVDMRYAAWGITDLKIIKFEKYSHSTIPPSTADMMYFLNIIDCNPIEVIGNIHEHSHLLEAK